jgi:glycosyltransferase involved in cell wall biosynthesis
MTPLPKITIITPSFNQGRYIEQTILSVIDQNYPNLEYIIIDGGSKDETVDVVKKYESKIDYWISEPDRGQSDAINKGFYRATGDIINWLNSDDYLAPGALQEIARSFQEAGIKAITTTVHNFQEDGEEWDERTNVYHSAPEYMCRAFNNQPGTFFRKLIWDRYFPLPAQLRYTMDQYLWFCFWMEHQPGNLKTEEYTSVFFRRHSLSKTSNSLNDIVFNHLGKVFFNEHNLIFWSYFNQYDKEKAEVISSYFWNDYDYRLNEISFPTCLKIKSELLQSLFQQYLFELLKEDYRHGFFERFRRNANYIQREYFSKTEMTALKKMIYKTANPALIKTYRSIYWKIKAIFNK